MFLRAQGTARPVGECCCGLLWVVYGDLFFIRYSDEDLNIPRSPLKVSAEERKVFSLGLLLIYTYVAIAKKKKNVGYFK